MLTAIKTAPKNNLIAETVRNTILSHIMKQGNFTIPQIASSTGYSLTTISKYVAMIMQEGLIKEFEPIASGGKGRRAILYGVSSDLHYFLGVDIKTFELNIGAINIVGEMVKIARRTDFRFENSYNTLEEICGLVDTFIKEMAQAGFDIRKIMGITFNLSGRVNTDKGTSASVFNFEETKETSLAEILKDRFQIPVFIVNDTKAMTYGEFMNLENHDCRNMLFVNAGWGLGIGIVIDGRLYYGKDGYSGEFGHVTMYDNNILCHCGKKGCIETEVSGSALSRKLIDRINNGEASNLSKKVRKYGIITTHNIVEAIDKEDPLCIDLVTQMGGELGRHLAGLINIFNPDIIVIGGNLSHIPECYFLQQIALSVYKYSLRLMSQNVPIISSALGVDAGVVGACMISRSRIIGV